MAATPPEPASAAGAAGAGAEAKGKAKAKPAPRQIPPSLRPFLYLGVPRSVLTWQPRLPSRNVSLFLLTVSTLSYLYYDDRKQCKRLRQHYIDRVRHLAQEPLQSWQYPRKIAVYAAMWPGDDDQDKSTLFFRRYVKPILVAAAIDWEVLHATRPGGLARDLTARIFARRRQLAGIEPWSDDLSQSTSSSASSSPPAAAPEQKNPFALSPEQQLQRELDGCIVLMGRPALKEWAYAMKQGWSSTLPLERVDMDEQLAAHLNEDSAFDELPSSDNANKEDALSAVQQEETLNLPPTDDGGESDGAGAPLPSRLSIPTRPGTSFNPAFQPRGLGPLSSASSQQQQSSSSTSSSTNADENTIDPILHPVRAALARGINPALLRPPPQIPAHAPLVFVDHENPIGWRKIPYRILGFFRHRDRVKLGGEAALRIALGSKASARDFVPGEQQQTARGHNQDDDDTDPLPVYPLTSDSRSQPVATPPGPQGGDLDWGLRAESAYPPYFANTLADITKSRTQWYDALPRKLQDTRTLERGEREPTRSERGVYRPKTERELKQERLEKEVEWRAEEHAFGIQRVESGVCWSERWRGSLRVMPEVDELPLPPPPPPPSQPEAEINAPQASS
ncbi:mitochondrial import inner membrane translocase subunit tim54 [Tilletia horrida]|nr:mitochondrial import inner membrane translocase subunit tim54 [Tilletia horrida]